MNFSFSKITLLILLMFPLLTMSASSYFYTNYTYKYIFSSQDPTVVKISTDENYVALGFKNGNVEFRALPSLNLLRTGFNHNYSIIDIEWIPGYGALTLDSGGVIIRWSSIGDYITSVTIKANSTYPNDMTLTSSGGSHYISLNFGYAAYQYNALLTNYTSTRTYYPWNGTYFKKILYNTNRTYLYAPATNASIFMVPISGSMTWMMGFNTFYSASQFCLIESQYMALLTTNNTVYLIRSFHDINQTTQKQIFGIFYIIIDTKYSAGVMAACPGTKFLVISRSNDYRFDVYNTTDQTIQQTLSYAYSSLLAVDCSSKYLVTVDRSYIMVNTYDPNPNPQPDPKPDPKPDPVPQPDGPSGVIITLIIFAVIGFIGFVGATIYIQMKKRKEFLQTNNPSVLTHQTF